MNHESTSLGLAALLGKIGDGDYDAAQQWTSNDTVIETAISKIVSRLRSLESGRIVSRRTEAQDEPLMLRNLNGFRELNLNTIDSPKHLENVSPNGAECSIDLKRQHEAVVTRLQEELANSREDIEKVKKQVRSLAEVITAVAQGDLSKQVEMAAEGEMLALKDTINGMIGSLREFASQVSKVAREVGTEGRLGGQAHIDGVSGCWRELSDNVNTMITIITKQVRSIAVVTTAVARGDLTKHVEVDAEGEIKELKITINSMVASLVNFSSEVTRVSREVGTEG